MCCGLKYLRECVDGCWCVLVCVLMSVCVFWCMLMCVGVHWYALVCIGMHWYALVCVGMHWYALVYNGVSWYVPGCVYVHWFVMVSAGACELCNVQAFVRVCWCVCVLLKSCCPSTCLVHSTNCVAFVVGFVGGTCPNLSIIGRFGLWHPRQHLVPRKIFLLIIRDFFLNCSSMNCRNVS